MSEVNKHPQICNICGGKVIYTTNDAVYNRKYGSGYCYLCTVCRAYVGTHKPRPKEALGLLANDRMRKGKIMCHDIFDGKWKKNKKFDGKTRAALYKWLARQLGIDTADCHFGYFDLDMLLKSYKILVQIKYIDLIFDGNGNIINEVIL